MWATKYDVMFQTLLNKDRTREEDDTVDNGLYELYDIRCVLMDKVHRMVNIQAVAGQEQHHSNTGDVSTRL